MKIQIKDGWLEVRPGVHMSLQDGILVVEPTSETFVPDQQEPDLMAIDGEDSQHKTRRRSSGSDEIRERENAVVARLLAYEGRDRFLRFGDLFEIIAPGVPAKRNGKLAREYSDVRSRVVSLVKQGIMEISPVPLKKTGQGRPSFGYRLAERS